MVSDLACQQKLVVPSSLHEEKKVEKFFLPNLSIKQVNIYSSNYLAAATTKRLGVFISTPKKMFPRAVDRNKIKRRIKSILFKERFNSKNFGLRFVIRKDFLDLGYKDAYNEINTVIKKACL